MAGVNLRAELIKQEPDLKEEPDDFNIITVKTIDDDDDEASVLPQRPMKAEVTLTITHSEGEEETEHDEDAGLPERTERRRNSRKQLQSDSGEESEQSEDTERFEDTDHSEEWLPEQRKRRSNNRKQLQSDSEGQSDDSEGSAPDKNEPRKKKSAKRRLPAKDRTPLSCPDCERSFKSETLLRKHAAVHKAKPHECPDCRKTFATKSGLQKHARSHRAEADPLDETTPPIPEPSSRRRNSRKRQQSDSEEESEQSEDTERFEDTDHSEEWLPEQRKRRSNNRKQPRSDSEGQSDDSEGSAPDKNEPRKKKSAKRRLPAKDRTPLSCPDCERSFKSETLLRKHAAIHKAKPHECPDCRKTFATKSGLQKHARSHRAEAGKKINDTSEVDEPDSNSDEASLPETGGESFSCPHCEKTFKWESHLRTHMPVHTGGAAEFCALCWKKFKNKELFDKHMSVHKKHLQASRKMVSSKGLTCSVCNQKLRTKISLIKHRRKVHKICPYCPNQYNHAVTLTWHVRAHEKNGTASKAFGGASNYGSDFFLEPHLLKHRPMFKKPPPKVCKHCKRKYKSKFELENHMRVHQDKPYKCPDCLRKFFKKNELLSHAASHGEDTRFRCSKCRKGFATRADVAQHMHKHEGKPFTCPACKAGFSREKSLPQHLMDQHFICPDCHQVFLNRFRLTLHQKVPCMQGVARKTFLFCSECGIRYKDYSTVRVHMKTHIEKGNVQCRKCLRRFRSKRSLGIHSRTHKPEGPQGASAAEGENAEESLTRLSQEAGEDKPPCYSFKDINTFLDVTYWKRAVNIQGYFPDLDGFINSVKIIKKRASIAQLSQKKRNRLDKLMRKAKKDRLGRQGSESF